MDASSPYLLEFELQTNALRGVFAGTEWIPTLTLAKLTGATEPEIGRWVASGHLFGVLIDRQRYFPRYALGENFMPLACISDVIDAFDGQYSDMALASWFESRSSFLAGARPRELIERDPARVIAAARDCVNAERHA